jgi:hypothetical protein
VSEWQETSRKERSERRQVVRTIGVDWSERMILLKLVRSSMIELNLTITWEISVKFIAIATTAHLRIIKDTVKNWINIIAGPTEDIGNAMLSKAF